MLKNEIFIINANNFFKVDVDALINPVNTVGVMGKGLALEFKKRYPDMFLEYRNLCKKKLIKIGQIWAYKANQKYILNFPTKEHWSKPSKIEYIISGLKYLVENLPPINSIMIPALGCSNGGLSFHTVRPIIEEYVTKLPIKIYIAEPL